MTNIRTKHRLFHVQDNFETNSILIMFEDVTIVLGHLSPKVLLPKSVYDPLKLLSKRSSYRVSRVASILKADLTFRKLKKHL